MNMNFEGLIKTLLGIAFILSLTGCQTTMDRIENVGQDPKMAGIENPVEKSDYQPVRMPMPAPRMEIKQANSLWTSGRKSFFKDQRASQVGDIMTVLVNIDDNAKIENKSEKTKDSSEDVGMPNLLGLETQLTKVLPEGTAAASLVSTSGATSNTGKGKIERGETIELKVAAVVTQILPNGNMVIHGKQQVRVSNERRDLEVAGIIRPEDITTNNSISYEKIAEARIAYGGQGMVTDANRPRYGNEIMDILLPF
jgi:flagellar L-ring protein precursor FlgH